MKKLVYLFLTAFIFGLTSCNIFSGNKIYGDHEKCDELMKNLTTYLMNDDYDNAKSLFAPKLYLIETFDSDLNELICYYDGKPNDIRGLVTTGHYSNFDYEEKGHSLEYNVTTDSEIYRFYLEYIEIDSRSNMNVGIINLYILKLSEDEYPEEDYVGALEPIPGIHVAYPHELPSGE